MATNIERSETIHCRRANDKYSMIDNEILQDPEISMDAQGIATYLLSLPSDWVIHPRQVWKSKKIGRDRVYKAFNELIKLGYMRKEEILDKNLKSEVNYHLSAFREFKKCLRYPEIQDPEIQDPEIQDAYKELTVEKTKNTKNTLEIDKSISYAVPPKKAAQHGQPKIHFDRREESFKGIRYYLEDFKTAYPNVRVKAEITKMKLWLLNSPAGKRRKGCYKFVNDWLSREEDRVVYKDRRKNKEQMDKIFGGVR